MTPARAQQLERFFDGELPEQERDQIAGELGDDLEAAEYLRKLAQLRHWTRGRSVPRRERPTRPVIVPIPVASASGPGRRSFGWAPFLAGLSVGLAAILLVGPGWPRPTIPPASGRTNPALIPQFTSAARGPLNSLTRLPAIDQPSAADLPIRTDILRHEMANANEVSALELLHSVAANLPSLMNERGRQGGQANSAKGGLLSEVKSMMIREEWSQAVDRLKSIVKATPHGAAEEELTYWLGYCQVRTGDLSGAVETLRPLTQGGVPSDWCDDALLQLADAHRSNSQFEEAVTLYRTLVLRFPQSVWRHDAQTKLLEILFNDRRDFPGALEVCESLLSGPSPPDASWQAAHLGAWCLTAERKFERLEAWIARWFNPRDAGDDAWRRLLAIYRGLLNSRPDLAFEQLDMLEHHYMELDFSTRLDLLIRAVRVLRQHDHSEAARGVLQRLLPELSNRPEYDHDAYLDAWSDLVGTGIDQGLREELQKLSEATTEPLTRAMIRERIARLLRDAARPDEAAALLWSGLATETQPAARVRGTRQLAEILAYDQQRPRDACRLVEEQSIGLTRMDLQQQLEELRKQYQELAQAAKAQSSADTNPEDPTNESEPREVDNAQ